MARKVSRQVLRTRRLLQEAIVDLIQEKDFSALRVEDITERADVGRATFYVHYKDKDDLLTTVVDGFYEEVVTQLANHNDPHEMIGVQDMLEHARKQPQFYRVILNHGPTSTRIRGFMVTQIRERLRLFGNGSSERVEMAAHFIAGAVLGVLRYWLDGGMEGETAVSVTTHIQQIIAQGIPAIMANQS